MSQTSDESKNVSVGPTSQTSSDEAKSVGVGPPMKGKLATLGDFYRQLIAERQHRQQYPLGEQWASAIKAMLIHYLDYGHISDQTRIQFNAVKFTFSAAVANGKRPAPAELV